MWSWFNYVFFMRKMETLVSVFVYNIVILFFMGSIIRVNNICCMYDITITYHFNEITPQLRRLYCIVYCIYILYHTVCPRSLVQFYLVSILWTLDMTSWTLSMWSMLYITILRSMLIRALSSFIYLHVCYNLLLLL